MPSALSAEQKEQLTDIFRDVLNVDNLELHDEMTAADVDSWDSFNHINLVMEVEEAFNVRFTTKEISTLANVGEFAVLIRSKTDG